MVSPTGIYKIQQRDDRTGRWNDVETHKPRTSTKEIRWLIFFKKIEIIRLDSVEDIRAQTVEKARRLVTPTQEIRVMEEQSNGHSWSGWETVWMNGKWID